MLHFLFAMIALHPPFAPVNFLGLVVGISCSFFSGLPPELKTVHKNSLVQMTSVFMGFYANVLLQDPRYLMDRGLRWFADCETFVVSTFFQVFVSRFFTPFFLLEGASLFHCAPWRTCVWGVVFMLRFCSSRC